MSNPVSMRAVKRGSTMENEGQLTIVACIVMAIVILTVAGYATIRIDIEAANPEREPPLGPEFDQARRAFVDNLQATYSDNDSTVTEAFNTSYRMVAIAEARYGFAFSADLTAIREISPGEYEISAILTLRSGYGHVSSEEDVRLKR